MAPKIGFVATTFRRPEQTLYLCERLTEMFGAAPIAIHHDFSQCDLDAAAFPSNVRFVKHWVATAWGSVSVVEATLRAYELLQEMPGGDPDWVVSLSAADYPIKTGERILSDLEGADVDAFMDMRRIVGRSERGNEQDLGDYPFRQPHFRQLAYKRYVAMPVIPLEAAREYQISVERYSLTWGWLTDLVTPFGDELHCYAGDAWITVNRRVVRLFLTDDWRRRKLLRHYRGRTVPEESFWHTLVGNTPEIRVSTENLRYTNWRGCCAHPRMLGREDLDELLGSPAHFARKFAFNPALLEEIDVAVARNDG